MKKILLTLSVALLFLFGATAVSASVMQLPSGSYSMPDGYTSIASQPTIDLDHYSYYHWYINDIESNYLDQIDIVFHDIYNWRNEENILNLYLMDYDGYQRGWDKVAWDGQSTTYPNWSDWNHLGSWTYPKVYPDSFDVVFSITDQSLLNLINNGNGFVLGIDPDCHYWGSEISVNAPVPEPATILLLGTGLFGIAGVGRKKRHEK